MSKVSPERQRFDNALKSILQVSKDELNRRIKQDEHERRLHKDKPGPKPSVSGRASREKH